jgi:hydroxymethylpyrimidine pyrophosphatase-like HAD family hydrolase
MKYNVIAVDFDGTIVECKYPEIGELIPKAKEVLTKYKNNGGQIIIWTCRSVSDLESARQFLIKNNIPFDAINEHLPWQLDYIQKNFPHVQPDCRKICADLYVDDRNPGGLDWDYVGKLLEED